jgi:hypothetical protein
MKMFIKILSLSLLALTLVQTSEAQAPGIGFAGKLSYRIQTRGNSMTTSGKVDQVVNNSASAHSGARVVMTLSKSGYKFGVGTFRAATVASSATLNVLEQYTAYNNVQLSGASAKVRGSSVITFLLINSANQILASHNFSKKIKISSINRESAGVLKSLQAHSGPLDTLEFN